MCIKLTHESPVLFYNVLENAVHVSDVELSFADVNLRTACFLPLMFSVLTFEKPYRQSIFILRVLLRKFANMSYCFVLNYYKK